MMTLSFTGCHESVENDISKVELAKGTCFGPCVPFAISIDNSFNYKFYADSSFTWNKKKPKQSKVNYTGIADSQLWSKLINELKHVDYKHPDTTKRIVVADAQHAEIIIYWGKNKTKIYEPGRNFDKVISLLGSSHTQIKLHPTNNELYFETTLQSHVH